MRRKTFTALLLAAGVPFVHAADPALLTEARQALAESIPQVAV